MPLIAGPPKTGWPASSLELTSAPARGQVVQVTLICLRIFVRHQSITILRSCLEEDHQTLSRDRALAVSARSLDSSELAHFQNALARASFIYSVVIKASSPAGQWAKKDLNFRPHAYQACALTN